MVSLSRCRSALRRAALERCHQRALPGRREHAQLALGGQLDESEALADVQLVVSGEVAQDPQRRAT